MANLRQRPTILRNANPTDILDRLQHHLVNSFTQLQDAKKCAVLFSGGVDSSLAALLTRNFCDDTLLITARGDGSHDAKVSLKAAKAMSLEIVEVRIDSDSLWEALPNIIKAMNRSNRMDVEIAIPFYFAGKEAGERGFKIMVSGQGPDELFGGYARYETMMVEKGPDTVEEALWKDVSITHDVNISRDCKIIKANGLHPFFPYLYPAFIETALTIPAKMNIDPTKRPARKLLFRELAMLMGVPKEIAMQQKRATQYSSGSSNMLLESLRQHVDELRGHSKKKVSSMSQVILDQFNRQQSMAR